MATKSEIVESAFRLGTGRYIQEDGAAGRLGEELALLGCSHPYIIHGKTALSVAGEKIAKSLSDAGMEAFYHEYTAFCNPARAAEIVESDVFAACDSVVAVGGGNACDLSKLVAAMSGKPVVTIPTSSATCAAYTPLSVCYNDQNQTIGTIHHVREVNCVLADMEILCRQPARLLLSGVYDSLAKLIEIKQRLLDKPEDEIDIGLRSSYVLSEFLYDRLLENLPHAVEGLKLGRNDKIIYDTVYLLIALTGVISSLARGSNQSAIAHKVYETTRTLFPAEAYDYLHGELVGIGLIPQLIFNGEAEKAAAFKAQMQSLGMPTTLSEVGIPATPETQKAYTDLIEGSNAMDGTTQEEIALLRRAFSEICQ
ncbi:MAG: iron-containing alcohol dehydrogenase [Clostridia bacterium]|nr:iron-containing alcohol dehydrogenase [Clostridia bacterium]